MPFDQKLDHKIPHHDPYLFYRSPSDLPPSYESHFVSQPGPLRLPRPHNASPARPSQTYSDPYNQQDVAFVDSTEYARYQSTITKQGQQYQPHLASHATQQLSPQRLSPRSIGPTTPNDHLLPVVIPQTSKAFGSTFASPFTRAYPPSLSPLIPQHRFLAFLDGLNEVFISHPAFQTVNMAGTLMGFAHGAPITQGVGAGLQFAAGLASAATSFARTKAYFKERNADLFHPVGLHAAVLGTRDMMAKVGHPEQRLALPPLKTMRDLGWETAGVEGDAAPPRAPGAWEDPRVRRLRTLEGYVAPLEFDVPEAVASDDFFNKMGAWQAKKAAKKHGEKEQKRLEKWREAEQEVQKERRKGEEDLAKKQAKLDRELAKQGKRRKESEIRKAERDVAKEQRKVEKKIREKTGEPGKISKEEKNANKIRWVVITQWQNEAEEDVVGDDDDDDDDDRMSSRS